MKALGIALSITVVFFVVELIGGVLTNSLVLQTDALHMLNDAFALAFALMAAWIAQRPITYRRTYGYYRAEILAAFVNGILLWGVVLFIFYEAFQRFAQPAEVKTTEMMIIAAFGLAANGLAAITLASSTGESLNIKGAFLHVISDILGSIGAISAAIVMFFTEWYQVDPLVSVAIGILVLYSSTKLIRESLNILLEGAPAHIDVEVLERRLAELEPIKSIHDLHVWCITPSKTCSMSCHMVLRENADRKRLMTDLIRMLKEEFGIDHVTVQVEDEGYPKASGEH